MTVKVKTKAKKRPPARIPIPDAVISTPVADPILIPDPVVPAPFWELVCASSEVEGYSSRTYRMKVSAGWLVRTECNVVLESKMNFNMDTTFMADPKFEWKLP